MPESVPAPTRLEKVVGVLAKATASLWAGGFVLLLVNSALIHQHRIYVIAFGAIRAGFAVAVIIVLAVIGSVILRKIRGTDKAA